MWAAESPLYLRGLNFVKQMMHSVYWPKTMHPWRPIVKKKIESQFKIFQKIRTNISIVETELEQKYIKGYPKTQNNGKGLFLISPNFTYTLFRKRIHVKPP